MEKEMEYAKLSGIEASGDLLKPIAEAHQKLSNLHEKRSDLENELEELEIKIKDFISKQAPRWLMMRMAENCPLHRKKDEGRLREVNLLLSEVGKLESPAHNELSEVKEKLSAFIRDRLAEGRAEMERQLEQAMMERARMYGTMRHGDKIRSTPPKKNSKSKIAVCEVCKQDIGLIRSGRDQAAHRREPFSETPAI